MRAFRGVGVAVWVVMSLLLVTASGATASQSKCLVVGAGRSYETLRAAVDAAKAGDKLKVKGTCFGDTTIGKSLTIVGQSNPPFGPATLRAQSPGPVIKVNEGGTVAITGLTITGGSGSDLAVVPFGEDHHPLGGGILNYGSLTLTNSAVTANTADRGGGILNYRGSLTLTNSTVTGNSADYGGGIFNYRGPLNLNGSSLVNANTTATCPEGGGLREDCRGGGIFNQGQLTLNGLSSVTGNAAPAGHKPGGGIFNYKEFREEEGILSYGTGWTGTVSGNTPDDIDFEFD